MSYQRIDLSKTFIKQLKKAPIEIRLQFRKRFELFLNNPHTLSLRNHSLKGKHIGLRSINITGDWRALYSERMEKDKMIVIFELLGTHSQLYK
ncbi:MAG: type II toxin-antitoxin system mRNA interferase toxin, RelE/StbE family [bacterium]|nr:type II toxin-antitoxin system mRNA interferase toxin, RelE/StbE family [bacterium]